MSWRPSCGAGAFWLVRPRSRWRRAARGATPAPSPATARRAAYRPTRKSGSRPEGRLPGEVGRREAAGSVVRPDDVEAPALLRAHQFQLPVDQLLPDQLLPDQLLPDQLLPDQLLPDQLLPDQLLPDQLLPDQLLPDQLLPDQLLPDQLLPDQLLPDQELPFQVPPGQLLPAASRVAMAAESKSCPKMSISPVRATPSSDTWSVPQASSSEPVPLDHAILRHAFGAL